MRDFDLSVVDVLDFLKQLDIEARPESDEARFSCPYPAHAFGDKNPSAYMNLESTAFICHSCGATGNAITFLADMKEVSKATAKNWIAEKWAPHYANIDDLSGYLQKMFAAEPEGQIEVPFVPLDEREYSMRSIDWQTAQHWPRMVEKYMFDRGFTADTLEKFQIVYDMEMDRPCITVRTVSGELVGFKGRAWNERQWPKYLVVGDTERTIEERGEIYGFAPYDASQHVYGAHLADFSSRKLIVCEGEFNVMAMHQKGFPNTVGPSGSTMSAKQIADIVSWCEEVTILFDSDLRDLTSAMTARSKINKVITAFEKYVDVRVCQDHHGDPNDLDQGVLAQLIDGAVSSTRFRIESMLHAPAEML